MLGAFPVHSADQIERLLQNFRADRDPLKLLEDRTSYIDSIIALATADCLSPRLKSTFAVTAVGGYGRRELFPYSDVDVLVLFENESGLAETKEPLAEFLRTLWDGGARVSHSVRTVEECCRFHEQNVELNISLLDLRLVCGDAELFEQLASKLPGFYARTAETISRHLAELSRQRHTKFNNTVYHLEPNLKEAPGGIRDIHLLRWLRQLAPRADALDDSAEETEIARRFLFATRCFLHFRSGRDNNLLSFELQDEASQFLPETALIPEQWMRLYYQQARRLFQSSLRALEYVDAQDQTLFRHFREWRGRVSSSEFTVSRERVFLRNPAETLSSAPSLLRLFGFVARHGLPISWDTNRRVRAEVKRLEAEFRERPPRWSTWHELFSLPNTALALHAMQETGILAAAIPEWCAIDSLVVRDFYHRYTVDEHSLVAVEAIDQLLTKHQGTLSRFYDLLIEEEDHATLRLALLLHDFGKGTTPGDHVRGSLDAADQILPRLGAPESTQNAIRFLIEHHLDLSSIMNGRDPEDPATARYLTSRVGTQEDLRRLTLLTYADISAVNPTAMTPWRLEQLWRVHTMGSEQLTRELDTNRIHDTIAFGASSAGPELARFLEGLPTRYLRTHTIEEIEQHFQLEQKRKREGGGVDIRRQPGAYLMTVVAEDQPGLFAKLCGALASFGMNIVHVEASSNAQGCVLDLFRFTDPMRTLELNPGEVNRLQWTVECVIRGSVEVSDLLKRRRAVRRPSSGARIVPAVRFNNDASDTSTLIDFIGEDRPGLLYDLTSSLDNAGCNIEVVLIDTEAHKAIDVFYVTRNGGKLDEFTQEQLRSRLIRAGSPA
jgi:[protein-PII] uridylyltransferase